MEVTRSKLNLPYGANVEIKDIADGSVRVIKYLVQDNTKALLDIEPPKSYESPNQYKLRVNLPSERKVDWVLCIQRSSANQTKGI